MFRFSHNAQVSYIGKFHYGWAKPCQNLSTAHPGFPSKPLSSYYPQHPRPHNSQCFLSRELTCLGGKKQCELLGCILTSREQSLVGALEIG